MEDIIAIQTAALRHHLGHGDRDGMPKSRQLPQESEPLFFVECSPDSTRGAKCKLPSCDDMIESGQNRIAITPAMTGLAWHASKNAGESHEKSFNGREGFNIDRSILASD
jgi:hypothetical protein